MTNREILDKIKNMFVSNSEPVAETPVEPTIEETKNALTSQEKSDKLIYIEGAIELASDDTIASIYDTLFSEVGEITPADPTMAPDAKEKIVENAHVEAIALVSEEETVLNEIKNQLNNFNTIVDTLKNENQELKNKIEEIGNKPSGNVVKVSNVVRELSPLEKQIEELKIKRGKK